MSLIDRELSQLTDGILSDPALREMNGSRYTKQEKDMSYLVPQRITVQRILLELSSTMNPTKRFMMKKEPMKM